jgi:hypothetical protein
MRSVTGPMNSAGPSPNGLRRERLDHRPIVSRVGGRSDRPGDAIDRLHLWPEPVHLREGEVRTTAKRRAWERSAERSANFWDPWCWCRLGPLVKHEHAVYPLGAEVSKAARQRLQAPAIRRIDEDRQLGARADRRRRIRARQQRLLPVVCVQMHIDAEVIQPQSQQEFALGRVEGEPVACHPQSDRR